MKSVLRDFSNEFLVSYRALSGMRAKGGDIVRERSGHAAELLSEMFHKCTRCSSA